MNCESVCVSVSHLVNLVPPHPPAVRVAPSVTLHCARCPVGTAFIQHDRTSLCSSFPLIPLPFTSVTPFVLIDRSFHPLHVYPSYSCSFFFLLPSIHPFLSVTLCGHSSAKQCLVGSRAMPHQQIVSGHDHKDRSKR